MIAGAQLWQERAALCAGDARTQWRVVSARLLVTLCDRVVGDCVPVVLGWQCLLVCL